MKYGLLKYTTNNIGDEIQSIAARQYLPRVDIYLKRDFLNQVENDQNIKLIMNGWFSHEPQNWPPSPNIEPLFVSFHISDKAEEPYTCPESIEYFSKHEPIGCRDHHTRDLLLENGIDAYFSGCLTTTLNNKYSDQNSGDIYIVDVSSQVLDTLPSSIHKKGKRLTHNYPITARRSMSRSIKSTLGDSVVYAEKLGIVSLYNWIWNHVNQMDISGDADKESKFQRAQEYLNKYAQAELVITRRLHAALPCVAFGTPVILVHENPDDPRFGGLKDYLNIYSNDEFAQMDSTEILSNADPPRDVAEIAEDMEETVRAFINTTV